MKRIVFVCSTKDFHAIDWYKSAKKICKLNPYILTDSKSSEGFKNLLNKKDIVFNLFLIDKLLFKRMSRIGNIWRNLIKLILLPLQVYLLKRFNKKYPNNLYYAHTMYFIWACHFAGLEFIGTPQGSEILVRTFKSIPYKYLSSIAIKSALFITCDSKKMAERIFQISKIKPLIIQNGIDIKLINKINKSNKKFFKRKKAIVSFRGLSPLYRTEEIFKSRELIKDDKKIPIHLIYPFSEKDYKNEIISNLKPFDKDLGKLSQARLLEQFNQYILYISIPSSDSSPRSVYECIFSGGIVGITEEDYYKDLPKELQERIILINLNNKRWLEEAINKANLLNKKPFNPKNVNLDQFDQLKSFKAIYKKLNKFY